MDSTATRFFTRSTIHRQIFLYNCSRRRDVGKQNTDAVERSRNDDGRGRVPEARDTLFPRILARFSRYCWRKNIILSYDLFVRRIDNKGYLIIFFSIIFSRILAIPMMKIRLINWDPPSFLFPKIVAIYAKIKVINESEFRLSLYLRFPVFSLRNSRESLLCKGQIVRCFPCR